jgi:hypothetical protein
MVASNIENDASLAQSLYMVGNATYEHDTLQALRSQVNVVWHLAVSSFTQYGGINEHDRKTSAYCRHTNNGLEGRPCADLLYDLTSNERPMLGSAQSNSSRSNERETMAEEETIAAAIAQSLQAQIPNAGLLPRYQTNSPPCQHNMQRHLQIIIPWRLQSLSCKGSMWLFRNPKNTRKHLIDSRRKNCANMSRDEKRKHAKVIDGLSEPYNTTLINVLKSVEEDATPKKANELLSIMEDMDGVKFDK